MKKNIIKFTLLLTLACRGVLGVDEQGRLLSRQPVEHSDAFILDALKLAVGGSHVLVNSNETLEGIRGILNNLRGALAGENGSTITPGTTRALDTLEDGEETLALTLPFQHTSENLAILEILRQFMVQHTKVRLEIDNTSLNVTPAVEGRTTMDITLKFKSTLPNRVMLERLRQFMMQYASVQLKIDGALLGVQAVLEDPAMGTAQEFIPDPYGGVYP